MARSIFISFHYQRDIWRVNIVRNHYLTKGGYQEAGYWDHSLWEETKRRGDDAVKRLIETGLHGTSVTVVLIGAQTASRRWVNYEIKRSEEKGNGIVGIYVHQLGDERGSPDYRGPNPLNKIWTEYERRIVRLSYVYPSYDWVDDNGYENFDLWVEAAAKIPAK